MLRELYDYAVREQLALPPGYVNKNVRAYVSLARDGAFLGIMPGGEKVPCPDIGSMANSASKCNLFAEKRCILFPRDTVAPNGRTEREQTAAKTAYFQQAMMAAAETEPRLLLCLRAMEDPGTAAAVTAELDRQKLKAANVISFMVDGVTILEFPAVRSWWEAFRQQFCPQGERVPCLITGQLTVPLATVPPISGLSVVGGHARGDALICFDKDAFCSYGLKQAANAPVSEAAFTGVKAALDNLLVDAPILAGMKFVHWYDKPLEEEEDLLGQIFAGAFMDEEAEDAEALPPPTNPNEARRQADNLVRSVKTGTAVHELPHLYNILLLSGVGGRVMVRSYQQGNYRELTANLQQWEQDLALTNSSGTGRMKPSKLSARLIRLIARQNSDQNIFDRLAKELAALTPAIIQAILNSTRFPDPVISRALAYIRSQMFSSSEEEQTRKVPDPLACQWLKACLCRLEREIYNKEALSVEYNEKHPEPAYHCGALVAVYGAIQRYAMPDVNASLIDRYYASASQAPALVLGQLARMSNYHISKREGLRTYFSNLRDQVACAIGPVIPTVLRPEQQAYFALGYYQMCARMEKDRLARKAAESQTRNEQGGM